jgi:hypothetical protein
VKLNVVPLIDTTKVCIFQERTSQKIKRGVSLGGVVQSFFLMGYSTFSRNIKEAGVGGLQDKIREDLCRMTVGRKLTDFGLELGYKTSDVVLLSKN